MIESDAIPPNSSKRMREAKEEAYTAGSKEISDKVSRELRISRTIPIRRCQDLPNQKSQNPRHEIQGRGGNGGVILSILAGGVMRLQIETV